MAVGFPTHEDRFYPEVWDTVPDETGPRPPLRIDALAVALLILMIFLAYQLLTDSRREKVSQTEGGEIIQESGETAFESVDSSGSQESADKRGS